MKIKFTDVIVLAGLAYVVYAGRLMHKAYNAECKNAELYRNIISYDTMLLRGSLDQQRGLISIIEKLTPNDSESTADYKKYLDNCQAYLDKMPEWANGKDFHFDVKRRVNP